MSEASRPRFGRRGANGVRVKPDEASHREYRRLKGAVVIALEEKGGLRRRAAKRGRGGMVEREREREMEGRSGGRRAE